MLKKIKSYIFHHKTEVALLIVILLISAFFRLYKISDYMTFLGDEGRDAIVAKEILEGNLTLLGPRASAGDFFLGPAYYYLIAPFLLLTGYDPVGPAIMVAIFGVATVFLVYLVSLKFFNRKAAIIASSLYAVSPLVVAYSRSSWNPNLMPFFSLLLLFTVFYAVKKEAMKYFFFTGLILGIAMQLHYLTVFLGVIIFMFISGGFFIKNRKNLILRYVKSYLLILTGFLIGLSPFLLFEIRHGFPNTITIIKFVFEDNTSEGYAIGQSFIGNIWNTLFRLFGRLILKYPAQEQLAGAETVEVTLTYLATIILAFFSIVALIKVKNGMVKLLLIIWLFFGVFLFGFYKKPIYDYYFGFMFPLPFFLVGNFLSQFSNFKNYKRISLAVSFTVFLAIIVLNISGAPFLYPGNKQKEQAEKIADFIISITDNKPYNYALLTEGNSDHVYRYFLEVAGREPVTIQNFMNDPQRKSVTEQLIVVCDYPNCSPLGHSLWEVAGFGRAEIVGEWDVPHVKIFKLKHYDGEDSNSQEN